MFQWPPLRFAWMEAGISRSQGGDVITQSTALTHLTGCWLILSYWLGCANDKGFIPPRRLHSNCRKSNFQLAKLWT